MIISNDCGHGNPLLVYLEVDCLYLLWLSVRVGVRVFNASLFYSIHNKSAPDYLCDLMPLPVGSVSLYNLRNSNNYVLPNCRLEITKKSFFPFSTRDWNNLNPEIKNSGNTNIFKRKIKNITLESA